MSSSSKANFFKGAGTRSKPAARNSPPPESASLPGTAERNSPPNKSKMDDPKSLGSYFLGMFEEIRKMSATLQVVAVDVVLILDTTKELKDTVANIQVRLGEAEQRLSDVEDVSAQMEKGIEKVIKNWKRCGRGWKIWKTGVEGTKSEWWD